MCLLGCGRMCVRIYVFTCVRVCGFMWLCGKKLGASRLLFVGQLLSQMVSVVCQCVW